MRLRRVFSGGNSHPAVLQVYWERDIERELEREEGRKEERKKKRKKQHFTSLMLFSQMIL